MVRRIKTTGRGETGGRHFCNADGQGKEKEKTNRLGQGGQRPERFASGEGTLDGPRSLSSMRLSKYPIVSGLGLVVGLFPLFCLFAALCLHAINPAWAAIRTIHLPFKKRNGDETIP